MDIPRIVELPATLASQIAAGEVIERPAAVVKELLDNSIDAGAAHVTVAVTDGGHKRISVSDDGQGIHPSDIELALRRHSTSKLNMQSDLGCITSLGFRGEALASIAAVSRFLLVTRTGGSDSAWSLSFDPVSGNTAVKPAARSRGTTVEAADIFQATPARRKFLRSRTTEFLHITEVFKRVACSRFNITFTLTHDNKPVLRYRACRDDMIERVADVFGRSFAGRSIPVNYEAQEMRLWGWLGGGMGSSSGDGLTTDAGSSGGTGSGTGAGLARPASPQPAINSAVVTTRMPNKRPGWQLKKEFMVLLFLLPVIVQLSG